MKKTRRKMKREVLTAANAENAIARSDIARWIASGDLRVLMEVGAIVLENSHRIEPPMAIEDLCKIVLLFFKRTFRELPRKTYTPTLEFVDWFRQLWNNCSYPRQYVQDLKEMLADLYRSGTQVVRDRVTDGVLEHLCETPAIAAFFADWRGDPELKHAYDMAIEWAESFGKGQRVARR